MKKIIETSMRHVPPNIGASVTVASSVANSLGHLHARDHDPSLRRIGHSPGDKVVMNR